MKTRWHPQSLEGVSQVEELSVAGFTVEGCSVAGFTVVESSVAGFTVAAFTVAGFTVEDSVADSVADSIVAEDMERSNSCIEKEQLI